jgi:hypothetical protein
VDDKDSGKLDVRFIPGNEGRADSSWLDSGVEIRPNPIDERKGVQSHWFRLNRSVGKHGTCDCRSSIENRFSFVFEMQFVLLK